MRRRAELLDVVEVAAVNDSENSEQPLEDGHGRLLEVLRVSGVFRQQKGNKTRTKAKKSQSQWHKAKPVA